MKSIGLFVRQSAKRSDARWHRERLQRRMAGKDAISCQGLGGTQHQCLVAAHDSMRGAPRPSAGLPPFQCEKRGKKVSGKTRGGLKISAALAPKRNIGSDKDHGVASAAASGATAAGKAAAHPVQQAAQLC
ncbi:MAG: hypothetical protein LBQ32_06520 [Burkholderiaceae bacterium]|jgi:hypothetical protein|nr:hypothetical protein [Burkholderiaceae bacterium]